MDDLQIRINKLERKVKVFEITLLCLISAGVLATQIGAAADPHKTPGKDAKDIEDVIRARKIEVLNKENQIIFSVSTDAINAGVLEVNHQNGKPLFQCRQGDFGLPGLAISTMDGIPVAVLGQNMNKQGGMLQIISKDKVPVLWATINEKAEGQLLILSKDAKTVKTIGLQP